MRELLLEFSFHELRAALVEHGEVVEFAVEDLIDTPLLRGDVFRARVAKLLPELSGALVDLGPAQALLQSAQFPDVSVVDVQSGQGTHDSGWRYVRQRLREGLEILVQIKRPPRNGKAALATPRLVVEGFFLSLAPRTRHLRSPWQLSSEGRARITSRLRPHLKDGDGLILHLRSRWASDEELLCELERLYDVRRRISHCASHHAGVGLVYRQSDPLLRLFLAVGHPELDAIWVDGDDRAVEQTKSAWSCLTKGRATAIRKHEQSTALFVERRVEQQVDAALAPNLRLPRGGSLRFDVTEGCIVIDVNSTSQHEGLGWALRSGTTDLAELNIEAMRVIATQLRLRNDCGSILVDFINARHEASRHLLRESARKCLQDDACVGSYHFHRGCTLLHIHREYRRPSLVDLFLSACSNCGALARKPNTRAEARGMLRQILRKLRMVPVAREVVVQAPAELVEYLEKEEPRLLRALRDVIRIGLDIRPSPLREPRIRVIT